MPPPVGTVSVKTPCGSAALATAARSTSSRSVLSGLGAATRSPIHACSAVSSAAIDGCSTSSIIIATTSGIESSGGGAVCVDQAGEDHAGEERHPEPGFILQAHAGGTGDPLRQHEAVSLGRALSRGKQVALGLDATFRAEQIVLQPSMVPRDDMREQPDPTFGGKRSRPRRLRPWSDRQAWSSRAAAPGSQGHICQGHAHARQAPRGLPLRSVARAWAPSSTSARCGQEVPILLRDDRIHYEHRYHFGLTAFNVE